MFDTAVATITITIVFCVGVHKRVGLFVCLTFILTEARAGKKKKIGNEHAIHPSIALLTYLPTN